MGTTKKSLEELTDKQLETEWTRASKELSALKDRCREFSQEHQRRAAVERARQALETMSDADKAALVQMVHTEGIESKEGMGEL